MCQEIHTYPKANNKYMKNYDKDIDSSHLMQLGATICMDGLKNYDENNS